LKKFQSRYGKLNADLVITDERSSERMKDFSFTYDKILPEPGVFIYTVGE
jgi:hypothetical protein